MTMKAASGDRRGTDLDVLINEMLQESGGPPTVADGAGLEMYLVPSAGSRSFLSASRSLLLVLVA